MDTRGQTPPPWRFVLMAIGRWLQEFYRPLLREPLPDRQRALVEKLVEPPSHAPQSGREESI